MRPGATERLVTDACIAELENRGMRRGAGGRATLALAPGITGFITPVISQIAGGGRFPVAIEPIVGVRHEEASLLASRFLGLRPGAHTQPAYLLTNIVPDASFPPRWLVPDQARLDDAARLLADDVVLRAYPWFESLSSARALIEKLASPAWRLRGAYVLAVLYMLDGRRLEDARQALMRRGLPVSHNPATWANRQFGRFLRDFAEHFDVDLETERWPLRQPPKTREVAFKIRDRAVISNGLALAGRADLASRVPDLTADQIDQIAGRGGAMHQSGEERDLGRAIGLAAAELLEKT